MDEMDGVPERHALIRKLESRSRLTEAERQALLDLPVVIRHVPAGQDVATSGQKATFCGLVLSGFLCRYTLLPDGRRQILGFHAPGDIPDLQSLHVEIMDHSLAALSPSVLAMIPHESLVAVTGAHPGVQHALWRETLVDAAIFRAWMVGLGRRSAHERVAHLLCEMALRFASVGLADGASYQMPVTQTDIADALGLSNVHVNRVLQDLRRDGLIAWRRAAISVLDWERLSDMAAFDAAYLHLRSVPDMTGRT